ncbi:MAG: hypothetical protein CMJ78_19995 [Planctomycetaceae bacterium]|nr:hypothetical protein [Planctomycetaceae bacterium]
MNTLRITILLALGIACPILAAEIDTEPVTLEKAREIGRTKSRLLQESQTAKEPSHVVPKADVAFYQKSIRGVLLKSCLGCHGPKRSEGRLRVDELNPDLLTGPDVNRWREIYNALSNSEMPPEDESNYTLADTDRGRIVDWLSTELNKASIVRRDSSQRSSFRRMTKYEYSYALQDVLGIKFPPPNNLPSETPSEDGFKNSSELLQMSVMQFETYRELAMKALRRAIVIGEQPKPVTYIVSMRDEVPKAMGNKRAKKFNKNEKEYRNNNNRPHLLNRETGEAVHFNTGKINPKPDAVVGDSPEVSPVVLAMPRSNELKMNLDRFLPDDGIMRVRIRAGRSTMKPNEYASLRLIFSAHTSNNANFMNVISQRDIPVTASTDDREFIHFDIPLSDIQRNPFRHLERTFPRRDEFLHIRNVSNAGGRDDPLHVYVDYIEITAPYYEQWPPQSHTNIFIASEKRNDETAYGREVLTKFMRRIWRRPVTSAEVDQLMDLFVKYRPQFATFEEAMMEVLATALATPEFLYLTQKVASDQDDESTLINDVELASRLSFFLWSSVPDDELLQLAEQGKLRSNNVVPRLRSRNSANGVAEPQQATHLKAQVDRMLADSRAQRFSKHFVGQWLGLDGLDNVAHIKDEDLKAAMLGEPVALFEEILKNNGNVMDFIHADYVMLNERLAGHYRIPNVFGPHFRKVALKPNMNRGGVLTGAAVLAMNSDGTDSNPLKRGVWMLERILHDPPPPPPPNVPEVDLTDPKILQMTLKERIADHRNKPACMSCHSRIDPWGIAFENYGALGDYRTQIKKKPVDANSELFNKQKLNGMDGLKRYLLTERQDQFAQAIVHKMTAYALGRSLSFSDRADIDKLTKQFRNKGDRLRDLIHLIVISEIFNSK